MLSAILQILKTALAWAFAGWLKKNDPSVAQREDQIERDYDARRKDLQNR